MKKILLILMLVSIVNSDWRQGEYKLEITYEHQLLPENKTVWAKHYQRLNTGQYYINTLDSRDLWVDNAVLLEERRGDTTIIYKTIDLHTSKDTKFSTNSKEE